MKLNGAYQSIQTLFMTFLLNSAHNSRRDFIYYNIYYDIYYALNSYAAKKICFALISEYLIYV